MGAERVEASLLRIAAEDLAAEKTIRAVLRRSLLLRARTPATGSARSRNCFSSWKAILRTYARLKLGVLYVSAGRSHDAAKQYEYVATRYELNGRSHRLLGSGELVLPG